MSHGTVLTASQAEAEFVALGTRLRRAADTLLAALNPHLRAHVAADLVELRGDIEGFLNRFGDRLDDRSRSSLIIAGRELAATIALLQFEAVGHA